MKELLLLTLLSLLLLATRGDRINALKFGETENDYIRNQPNMQPFETGFTVCAWIRKLRTDGIPTWFSYAVSGQAYNEIEIADMGDRTSIFGERYDLRSLYTVTHGTWFHNCLGWDATSQTSNVYINGALVNSKATPAGRTLKLGGYLVLGNEQYGYGTSIYDVTRFSGEMFKLNMFSKKLSDHDIKEMATDMCSVVEETHGEVRGIKWEDVLQQTRTGNVTEIESWCIKNMRDTLGKTEAKLNSTLAQLENKGQQLNETIRELGHIKDLLGESANDTMDCLLNTTITYHLDLLLSEKFFDIVITGNKLEVLRKSMQNLGN